MDHRCRLRHSPQLIERLIDKKVVICRFFRGHLATAPGHPSIFPVDPATNALVSTNRSNSRLVGNPEVTRAAAHNTTTITITSVKSASRSLWSGVLPQRWCKCHLRPLPVKWASVPQRSLLALMFLNILRWSKGRGIESRIANHEWLEHRAGGSHRKPRRAHSKSFARTGSLGKSTRSPGHDAREA